MKAWQETWFPGQGVLHTDGERIAVFEPVNRPHEPLSDAQRPRARLAAAAPELARALLRVERDCKACGALRYGEHTDRCPIDAALTKAGLPPEMRDAAREAMGLR